ncbi:lipocalin [Defluviimonas sp. WL0075]|uniref:Lipocalin n=1 Tax=Albidovulum sediminicola TaxID=2984331 RepID=A0ABT2YXE1_9RHOB|nr:lipocalin [Defluviimonas sp. WL0075]MCV2863548.1 lipocalin [Defluviimonas sp. WL0075]
MRITGRRGLAALLGLAVLAGCDGGARPLRDPDVMIASLALFDPARMAGTWHLAAAFGGEAACGPLAEAWTPRTGGALAVTGQGCRNGAPVALDTVAMPSGPGRFSRRGPAGVESLWLLWVDGGDRVAVIGTPDGRFGRILSRDPGPRGDLMQAARDVLAFNGYDLSRLVRTTP